MQTAVQLPPEQIAPEPKEPQAAPSVKQLEPRPVPAGRQAFLSAYQRPWQASGEAQVWPLVQSGRQAPDP